MRQPISYFGHRDPPIGLSRSRLSQGRLGPGSPRPLLPPTVVSSSLPGVPFSQMNPPSFLRLDPLLGAPARYPVDTLGVLGI